MRENRVTATFEVSDKNGISHRLQEISTFETGKVIGGKAVVTGVAYQLDNGTRLEGTLDGQSFFNRSSGATYTRV